MTSDIYVAQIFAQLAVSCDIVRDNFFSMCGITMVDTLFFIGDSEQHETYGFRE